MDRTTLLAGTSKGLVVFNYENDWKVGSIHFHGLPVTLFYRDERNGTWWASISHRHWGEKLHYSADEGRTWMEASIPTYQGYFYKKDTPASLKRIWTIAHSGKGDGLWLGTEPGGLFYSPGNANGFQLVESLWNHPSRTNENQWFGAGKDFPFIHSIVVDPGNSDHVYVAISCAGIFETTDGGKSWEPRNKGLKAAYLPNPSAELGHDPHRLLMCNSHTSVLWQQNHCGIFRTTNGGAYWNDVSGKDGFPSYGFAHAIGEDENTAWVIPAESDERRLPVGLKLSVCKTTDGGKTWTTHSEGLPGSNAFDLVLRHCLARKGNILCFGTTNGNIYLSLDAGERWKQITGNLATVNCLSLV